MILRIKNIDGWLLYKEDCIPLIDKSLNKNRLFPHSLSSCILRIEDFLVNATDRIAIYISLEKDKIVGLFVLMVSDEFDKYDDIIIRSCCIYTIYIKSGYIWKFIKHAHFINDFAISMNCNKITCSSIRDWEKFADKFLNSNLKLKQQYRTFEIGV